MILDYFILIYGSILYKINTNLRKVQKPRE